MGDLISRQAAIDLCDWYDNPSMHDDLEKLPSAEPAVSFDKSTETKRCSKDTWTTEEVAEILANMFGDDCACNYSGIDEWLPESCKYVETGECPDPKEKNGCWVQFLMQGGGYER